MSDPVATVLIVTRNRRERVADAVRSALAQTPPVAVLVVDDASTDGTADHLARAFPAITVARLDAPSGCPGARNHGVSRAKTDIVVCLDDDLTLPSPNSVAQTAAAFDDDRIAVVTIPYINVRRERFERQRAPKPAGSWVTGTFAGGASAVRRSAFLECGGYPDFREHGEETDLALRLLDAGGVVRLGTADGAVHDEASVRKSAVAFAGSSRNHLLTVWRTVPSRYLPGRFVAVAAKVLLVGLRGRRPTAAARGVGSALRVIVTGTERRAPVTVPTYRTARHLMRRGPRPLDEVMQRLGR